MIKGVIRTILMSLGISMSIGLGSFAVNRINNVSKAEALSENKHLYVKVTDRSQLSVGDVIVLATPGGRAFTCPAGNPRYLCMDYVAGMSNGGDKLFCDESQVDRLELVQGSKTGSFALKCLDVDGYNMQGKYISWVEREDIQPHDKGNVGYYLSNLAFRTTIDDKSSWFFSFDADNNYTCEVDRSDEPAENYGIFFGGSNARPALYYTWNSDQVVRSKLVIFKEIDRSKFSQTAANVITQPTNNIYHSGDLVDLSGLELYFEVDGYAMDILYDDEPGYFTNIGVAQATGHVYIEYCEMPYNVPGLTIVPVTNDLTIIDYTVLNESYHDYRGTYVLSTNDGYYATLIQAGNVDADPENNNENAVSYTPLTNYEYTPDPNYPEQTVSITQVYANSLHLIQNPGGNANSKVAKTQVQLVHDANDPTKSYLYSPYAEMYLCYQDGGEHDGNLLAKSAPSSSDAVTVSNDGQVSINGRTLVTYIEDYETFVKFVSDPSGKTPFKLYRKNTDATFRNHIDTFVSSFLSKTSADCQAESVQSSTWTSVQSDYADLTLDEKGYLANIEYVHSANEGLSNEYNVVDRYDYIISKYEFSDFMDRKAANTWQDNYPHDIDNSNLSKLIKEISNKNAVMVFAVLISITSVSALLFVFYKKKKHQ